MLSILSAAIRQDFSIASGTTGKRAPVDVRNVFPRILNVGNVLGNQRLFLNLLCFEIKALRQVGEVVSTGILSAFPGSQIVSVVQILIEDSTCSMFAHLMNESTLGLDFDALVSLGCVSGSAVSCSLLDKEHRNFTQACNRFNQ